MNIEYQVVHNLKELRSWTSKGYKFLVVLDPNSWLMIKQKEPETISLSRVKPQIPVEVSVETPDKNSEVETSDRINIRVKEIKKIKK